jgi:type IV pilus assembly protein PilE
MKARSFANARRETASGFTLVELMIAVVIVALLASIALPSFMDSIRKSRRSEAFAALSAVQQAQERWRGNHGSYAGNGQLTLGPTDDPPGLGQPATTKSGYYGIAIAEESATGYTITASAKDGTSQASDTACRQLGVRMAGGNLSYAGGSGDLAYSPTHPCWAK